MYVNYDWRNSIKGLPQKKNQLYNAKDSSSIKKLFKDFHFLELICLFITTLSWQGEAQIVTVGSGTSVQVSPLN